MPHSEMSLSERMECKLQAVSREEDNGAHEKERKQNKESKEKCSLLFCIFHSL
jgi:hypothetical protein